MKKIINNLVIISIIIILFFAVIVSQDEYHLEVCHEDNCFYCMMIHFAQKITCIVIAFIIAIIVGVLIHFYLARLYKERRVIRLSSLVFQKVQFNE